MRAGNRRLRAALTGAGAVALAATVLAPHGGAAAGGPLDVTAVHGNAAAVEVTVRTGYSFVVYPDAQLPRAEASIEADRVHALAGPADPGDSVDTLPGLAAGQAEGAPQAALYQAAGQAPPPFNSVFTQAAQAAGQVMTAVTPLNPLLTAPYERVEVEWPQGTSQGAQQAALVADPSAADPTGNVAVEGAAGRVMADSGVGVADAGAGTALFAPNLGLRIGRVSSHVEVHGGATQASTTVTSSVSDVDLTPPGLPPVPGLPVLPGGTPPPPLLHIGSITATVTSVRSASATAATSAPRLEISGVTVAGEPATIDQNGVHLAGHDASLQPLVDALNGLFDQAAGLNRYVPPGLPVVAGQPLVPAGHLVGPLVGTSTSHGGDEATGAVTGLTLSLAGTILTPSDTTGVLSNPDPRHPPTLVASPALYTISLATASASAYGTALPTDLGTGGSGGLTGTSAATGAAAGPATVTSTGAAAGTATGAATHHRSGLARIAGLLDSALLSRPAVIAFASLIELLLLGALLTSYRMASTPRAIAGRDPTELV